MNTSMSLRDQVIHTILSKIQHHELVPNEIFTEQQICDELEISRTPVREALLQLISDNVIVRLPRKGYTVKEFQEKTKLDLYVILADLDALAARLSIDNITDTDLLKMNEIVEKLDIAIKYRNYSDYYSLQDEFHNIYIHKCDNPTLINLLENLSSGPVQRSYISNDTERLFMALQESNEEHREIIRLFEQKDAQGLEKFLRETHWITKYIDMI